MGLSTGCSMLVLRHSTDNSLVGYSVTGTHQHVLRNYLYRSSMSCHSLGHTTQTAQRLASPCTHCVSNVNNDPRQSVRPTFRHIPMAVRHCRQSAHTMAPQVEGTSGPNTSCPKLVAPTHIMKEEIMCHATVAMLAASSNQSNLLWG